MVKSNKDKYLYLLNDARRMDSSIYIKQYECLYKSFLDGCNDWKEFDIKKTNVGSLIYPLERLVVFGSLNENLRESHLALIKMSTYVVFTYRQLRMVKKKKNVDLYIVSMHEMSIHACLALLMNKKKQAHWIANEYRFHYDAGYQGKDWFDVRFAAFSDFLMGWMINGKPDLSVIRPEIMGRYYVLANLVNKESDFEKTVLAFLDERLHDSYCVRKGVQNDLDRPELDNADEYDSQLTKPDEDEFISADEPPFFYTSDVDFLACFAFEVAAFISLLSDYKKYSIFVGHVLLTGLNDLPKENILLEDERLARLAHEKFSKWEQELDLPIGCSPLDN